MSFLFLFSTFLTTLRLKGLTAEKKSDYAASSNNKCCVCFTQKLKKCHNLLKGRVENVWLAIVAASFLPLSFLLFSGCFFFDAFTRDDDFNVLQQIDNHAEDLKARAAL